MARTVRKIGDWRQAQRILQTGPMKLKLAMDRAVLQEAHLFRKEMVEGIKKQAPGGKAFQQLAETTIATRRFRRFRGTKALIVRGDLRNSITVKSELRGPDQMLQAFVGVLRTARSRDGKSLVNIAEVHEFGSKPIVIEMTPKMRGLLHLMFRQAGLPRPARGTGASGVTYLIVTQIPARPFMRPVFEKLSPGASRRFMRRVDHILFVDFGKAA